jgi:DNA repair photolyase
MTDGNSRKQDYVLSDELPEIHAHSNTQYCPLIYELIPAHGCAFECEYCNVYNLKAESCFYPITVFRNYPGLVDKTVRAHQAEGVNPVYYFSPKTDIFQPALVETGVTRNILEVLVRNQARYILVTKGKLPGPEILDLLVQSGGAGRVLVSYGMKNQAHADVLEPFAATLEERFDLAANCTRNGIPAMGVIEPILPLRDLSFVEDIIRKFVSIGIDHFAIDFARISLACLDKLIAKLPELAELNEVYRSPEAISQDFGTGPYKRETVERFAPSQAFHARNFTLIDEYARKQGATVSICNYFRVPGINTRAYERGFLCFGIYDKERAAAYAAESRKVSCVACGETKNE